jgi:hypothetical protein
MINTNFLDVDNQFFNHVRTRVDRSLATILYMDEDVWCIVAIQIKYPMHRQQVFSQIWRKVLK